MNEAKEGTKKKVNSDIAAVETLLTAWETGNLSQTASLLADSFRAVGAAPFPLTREDFVMFQRVHNEAFPDWTFNVNRIEAKDDKICVTCRIKATHTGSYDLSKLSLVFQSIQPTGKTWPWSAEYMIFTVKSGKITHLKINTIAENWIKGIVDWLGIKLPISMV